MVEVAARKEGIKTRGGQVEFGPLGGVGIESAKGRPLGSDAGFVENRAGFVAPEHLNVNAGKGVNSIAANVGHGAPKSEGLSIRIAKAISESDKFETTGAASRMIEELKSIK